MSNPTWNTSTRSVTCWTLAKSSRRLAIKAGIRLMRRVFSDTPYKEKMNYDLVPTTVFTPLEYGTIGMSEELAVETYGADNVECYISYFKPLEWSVNHEENNGVAVRGDNKCFVKLITNLADDERVVGFHYLGPNAGEVTQGYAVAMKMGAKKSDFDETVGIHPTVSEKNSRLLRSPSAVALTPRKRAAEDKLATESA